MADWASIQVGDKLPELKKKPGVTQLVKYAAGSGDFNPLHHDYNFPQAREIGSIIVHGRFKYASLGELVSNWLEHKGFIRKITCQYRGMDFPDKEFVCRGEVTKKYEEGGQKIVEISMYTQNEAGQQTTPGTAVVVFK